MSDRNINPCETKVEQQRYNISMLPTQLLIKGTQEGKGLVKQLTKKLSKMPRKKQVQIANIFDDLATTQRKGSISKEDVKLIEDESLSHPYESLLRSFGAETADVLLEHTKVIDSCLSQKLNNQLIINFKDYLSDTFNYKDDDLHADMPADEFYLHLVLSFIAHLDAQIHHAVYSEDIAPISLGWLFMQKLNPDKWEYDGITKKYNLTNRNGSPFTCTSRSFIHFLLTDLYFYSSVKTGEACRRPKPKKMPKSIYGLRDKIDWKTNDKNGQLYSFLDIKSERDSKRNWISLEEFYWLLGMQDSAKDKSNDVLINWQESFVKYIKTEDVSDLKGLPPSAEVVIWFIYAFFQNIYEHTDKYNKANKEKSCVIYSEYYDSWKSFTVFYEQSIDEQAKNERTNWPDYLKDQATPIIDS